MAGLQTDRVSPIIENGGLATPGPPFPHSNWLSGVSAHSALLRLDIPLRITGKWWCDTRIEVLTRPTSS